MAAATYDLSAPAPPGLAPWIKVEAFWPIAVAIDDQTELCEVRDVTTLLAALVDLGLHDRYDMAVSDLMAVALAPITFGPADPTISKRLRHRVDHEDIDPACVIALDLHVAAVLGRWTPPRWLREHIDTLVLSEPVHLPAKGGSTNPSQSGRRI
jgi:hypothetical protein